jgi:hypothetical protein
MLNIEYLENVKPGELVYVGWVKQPEGWVKYDTALGVALGVVDLLLYYDKLDKLIQYKSNTGFIRNTKISKTCFVMLNNILPEPWSNWSWSDRPRDSRNVRAVLLNNRVVYIKFESGKYFAKLIS